MNRSLTQIVTDHMAMGELLSELSGELDLTTEQWLAENQANLASKIDGYKAAMDILDNAEEFLKAKAQPFLEAAKVCSNRRDALKERIKYAMQVLQLPTLEGNDYVFNLVDGANKLVVENEDQIPSEFSKEEVIISLDKEALKKALEAGEKIPGAKLEKIQSLRCKVNATTIKPKTKKGKQNESTSNT